jgi:hypothetical protein
MPRLSVVAVRPAFWQPRNEVGFELAELDWVDGGGCGQEKRLQDELAPWPACLAEAFRAPAGAQSLGYFQVSRATSGANPLPIFAFS